MINNCFSMFQIECYVQLDEVNVVCVCLQFELDIVCEDFIVFQVCLNFWFFGVIIDSVQVKFDEIVFNGEVK